MSPNRAQQDAEDMSKTPIETLRSLLCSASASASARARATTSALALTLTALALTGCDANFTMHLRVHVAEGGAPAAGVWVVPLHGGNVRGDTPVRTGADGR